MARYQLGNVRPHVEKAANLLGPMFGIRTIGGYRANGSVPGSDHPKGRALDLMTNSKSVGDRLAEYAIKHYKALGITYVIWWRQIWQPGSGWQPYSGPSDHTDHVHLSFGDKGGNFAGLPDAGDVAGAIGKGANALVPDTVQAGIKGVAEQLKSIGAGVAQVGKVAELVTSAFLPNNIVRGVSGLAGTLCILIGIVFLSREARQ